MTFMIYGANGYTGRLAADLAAETGLRPILAGRTEGNVRPLAEALGCPHRVFDLADAADHLDGVDVVLHCAGPFSATSAPMLDACIATGTHYLDITGEIAVFEAVFARHDALVAAGVVAIPGVGFDVVPTDAMAAKLAKALPSATHLELAFAGLGGGLTQGTAKTAVEGLPMGGAARIDGVITKVPAAWKTKRVPLGGKDRFVVSIPWGDVSTAFHTTGIPNIITYTNFPPAAVRWMKLASLASPLLALGVVQSLLKKVVELNIEGPTADARAKGRSVVWGRVEDDAGRSAEGTLSVCEGYLFTARSGLAAVARVQAGEVAPGAWTPSRAFGDDYVEHIEGTVVDDITLD